MEGKLCWEVLRSESCETASSPFLQLLTQNQLYCADDNFTSTIARFHPSHRIPPSQLIANAPSNALDSTPTLVEPPSSGRTPATLELAPRAVEIQDLVVTSFLFLEKSRRTNENTTENMGHGVGVPSTF